MSNERIEKLVPALLPWYGENKRRLPWRDDPSPYHVWVSEIMLQQTRIEAVMSYYERFLSEIPDIRSLAEADPEHLHKLWEGLGYYTRVRNLQAAAKQIMEEHDGVFPDAYEEIRKLKGIGEYTAGAIGSICFGLPVPAVDGNVLRVVTRITGDRRSISLQKTKSAIRKELADIYPVEHAGEFTQALMELGEIVCLPNGTPDCERCPCRDFCLSRDGGWRELPVKEKKKERKKQTLTVFVLRCQEHLAVKKRKESGLLAGLFELPNVEGDLTAEEALSLASQWNLRPEGEVRAFQKQHIFTHVEWQMHCYEIRCRNMAEGFFWTGSSQLKEEIALPTAFRKVIEE